MNKNLILISVIVVLAILLAAYFIFNKNKDNTALVGQENTVSNTSQVVSDEYTGKLLAGTASEYREFNQKDYEKALKEDKIIFLDFYANWCPICRAEAPEITAGFNNLNNDKIIGFRVNYNDSDTDKDEKELAAKFQVTYQHTKVILENGQVILKDLDQWDKQRFTEELAKLEQ